jgi:RHS repeat-associated protein
LCSRCARASSSHSAFPWLHTSSYDLLDRKTYEKFYTTVGGLAGQLHWQYDRLGRVELLSYDIGAAGMSVVVRDYDDMRRITAERNYEPGYSATGPKVEQRYEYEQFLASDWQHSLRTYSQWETTNGTNFTNIGTTKTFVDPMGRVARIEDTPAGQSTKKIEYYYDQASRVIDVARTAGTFFFDTRYQYDFTDPHNRLKDDGTYTYLYDKEGNRTRKTAKVGGAYTVYTWDHRNRLLSVVDHESGGTITNALGYAYNTDDLLASRTKYYYDDGEVEEAFTSYFTYDGNDLVLDLDPEMGQRHRYLWSDVVDTLLADDGSGAQIRWAATDHLGSVNDLLDASENIVQHREYNSFGEFDAVYDGLGQLVPNGDKYYTIGHAGSIWDGDAQVYRKGNRVYDPGTSQFLTTDFGGFVDGPNPYWYAHNNPILYFDPSRAFRCGTPVPNYCRR